MASETSILCKADADRVKRIAGARLLLDGLHRQFFLDEGRTQFSFARVINAGGKISPLYITDNVLRLVSLKAADLVFGESPILKSDSSVQDERLQALAERCNLQQLLHGAAVDASAEREAFLEALVWENEVYIQQVDGMEMFPVGRVMPDGQHAAYLRRTIQQISDSKSLMLETTYKAGSIERKLWDIGDGTGDKKPVDLNLWPEFQGKHIQPVQATGIPWNTMVWIPNLLMRRMPVSDYDSPDCDYSEKSGIVQLQDALNAKCSQMAMVILKHANPKLLLPAEAFENGKADARAEAYPVREGGFEPKYVTWEAQLAAATADRDYALDQLLSQTETCPELIGLNRGGAAPVAFRTLRLKAINTFTKAARRAVLWQSGVNTILTVASMLEQTLPGVRYDLGRISVELRDGIPDDGVEHANELSILRSAGLKSVRQGLKELLGSDAAVEAEMEELTKESATERRSDEATKGQSDEATKVDATDNAAVAA